MDNLVWIKEGEKYFLKTENNVLIVLTHQTIANAIVTINQKNYSIYRKGSWRPAFYIKEEETEIVKLSHNFWGSNGKIICWDDTVYKCEYLNKGGLKLRFLDGENELFSYNLTVEPQKQTISFSIGNSMEDAEKLLLLVALGMVLFASLVGDNISSNDDNATMMLMVAAS
jgi:hypothetical protein